MDAQVINIVEQAVLERMTAKESFTALDISNALKADRYPVRHREVAEVVRDIYHSDAMSFYNYRRKLIPVITDGGAKQTESYLYYHENSRPEDYVARHQDALPPVSPDQARDLSDCVAASPIPILSRPARPSRAKRTRTHPSRSRSGRRDGALSIPRSLIRQLGWTVGDTFSLVREPDRLLIAPTPSADGVTVRVWSDFRIRVCRSKLRLGALTADIACVDITGSALQIKAIDA